jgi:hypothetical protein
MLSEIAWQVACYSGNRMSEAAPRIGLACPRPRERLELLEWCETAGFHPIPMIDASSITRELDGEGFEALIIDADLTASRDAAYVIRTLDRNRPLIVIGDDDATVLSKAARRDVAYLKRPVERDVFVMAVALALAEGRPARRSPRQVVPRIHATVESVPVRIIDVSYEGIRLEVPERHRSTLPPFFAVRVPIFNVSVVGKRVWVNNALNQDAQTMFWCGVKLERNTERAKTAWLSLVEHAGTSASTNAGVDYL